MGWGKPKHQLQREWENTRLLFWKNLCCYGTGCPGAADSRRHKTTGRFLWQKRALRGGRVCAGQHWGVREGAGIKPSTAPS